MANRTALWANSIRGTDPQNLVSKILRNNIYKSSYWKAHCFGLTAATLVGEALKLDHIGGTCGSNQRPTPFMCLLLKMLQLQPDKATVQVYIKDKYEDRKYVRVLGAFYMRLTGSDTDLYNYLEPLYLDKRKLRRKLADGSFALTHVDEVVEELVREDFSCDIALPRIKKRVTLESIGLLGPRKSCLDDDEVYLAFVMNPGDEQEEPEEVDNNISDEGRSTRSNTRTTERDLDRRIVTRDSHDDRIRDRGRGGRRDHRWDHDDRNRDHEDHDRYRRRQGECYRNRSSRANHHEMSGRCSSSRDEPKKKKTRKDDYEDPEIAEANRLRASLGLKSLKL